MTRIWWYSIHCLQLSQWHISLLDEIYSPISTATIKLTPYRSQAIHHSIADRSSSSVQHRSYQSYTASSPFMGWLNASSFNGKMWAASDPLHCSQSGCLISLKLFVNHGVWNLHSTIDNKHKLHYSIVLVFDIVHNEPGLSAIKLTPREFPLGFCSYHSS